MDGFSERGSTPLASTNHFHVIGEFIELPHLGKLYCSSGGSVCFGQDIHKITKFERNGEFERALDKDGVSI